MSKPVYKNSAFWLIVVVLLILVSLLVVVFLAALNARKARLLDEQAEDGSAQIGIRWHTLARRERQFLEIVGRQRPHGFLRRVCCHPLRGLREAPIRPDPGQIPNPLSEKPGLCMPGKVEKRAFFGKVDSPMFASLADFWRL